jgi:hypothetical protein
MYIFEPASEGYTTVSEFMVSDTKFIPASEICMLPVLIFLKTMS